MGFEIIRVPYDSVEMFKSLDLGAAPRHGRRRCRLSRAPPTISDHYWPGRNLMLRPFPRVGFNLEPDFLLECYKLDVTATKDIPFGNFRHIIPKTLALLSPCVIETVCLLKFHSCQKRSMNVRRKLLSRTALAKFQVSRRIRSVSSPGRCAFDRKSFGRTRSFLLPVVHFTRSPIHRSSLASSQMRMEMVNFRDCRGREGEPQKPMARTRRSDARTRMFPTCPAQTLSPHVAAVAASQHTSIDLNIS